MYKIFLCSIFLQTITLNSFAYKVYYKCTQFSQFPESIEHAKELAVKSCFVTEKYLAHGTNNEAKLATVSLWCSSAGKPIHYYGLGHDEEQDSHLVTDGTYSLGKLYVAYDKIEIPDLLQLVESRNETDPIIKGRVADGYDEDFIHKMRRMTSSCTKNFDVVQQMESISVQ